MSEVRTFGVIGAGQMGRGIAQVAAQHGYRVLLLDVSVDAAAAGKQRITKDLGRLVDKGRLAAADRDAAVERVEPVSSYSALAEAEFVVEAATEALELKQRIFADADR